MRLIFVTKNELYRIFTFYGNTRDCWGQFWPKVLNWASLVLVFYLDDFGPLQRLANNCGRVLLAFQPFSYETESVQPRILDWRSSDLHQLPGWRNSSPTVNLFCKCWIWINCNLYPSHFHLIELPGKDLKHQNEVNPKWIPIAWLQANHMSTKGHSSEW